MNLLDILILFLVLSGIVFGYQRGLWLTAFEYAGFLAGITFAAAGAPLVVHQFNIVAGRPRFLLAVGLLVFGSSIGSALGHAMGEPLRRAMRDVPVVRLLDGIAGAALTAAVTLATVWYVGLSLSRGPSPILAQAISRSEMIRALDGIAPRPPALLAQLERTLSGQISPQVFAGLEPGQPRAFDVDPAIVDSSAVRGAAAATVRVEAPGCGGVNFGSGFPVAAGYVLTNAHVVTGTRSVAVRLSGARDATPGGVVLFDPDRDVAILYIPGLALPPLATATAAPGTQTAIIGYPGGGPEQIVPAVIDGRAAASGRDIFSEHLVTRDIWIVGGQARPGNSGGPLVDANGRVVGVVFASSAAVPNQAYALTGGEVASDVAKAIGLTAKVNTLAYDCSS